MATVTHVGTLPDSSGKDDFYAIIDNATVTGIVNADCAAGMALADSKLAQITTASKVSGAAITALASVPGGAGVLPTANLPLALTAAATGFTIAGGTTSKTLTVDETVAISAKATEVAWTDYFATSTITGWADGKTGEIRYKRVGGLVFVQYSITGTSNSATTSFTLPTPYCAGMDFYAIGLAIDNGGAYATGIIGMAENSATVTLNKALAVVNNWTASGTKTVQGQFCYITA